jgi:hypothetical protein
MPLVRPYAGQNQPAAITVPATIVYQSYQYSPEEGPWSMPPYEQIFTNPVPPNAHYLIQYPAGSPGSQDFLPPSISKTDLWSAMQTYPL